MARCDGRRAGRRRSCVEPPGPQLGGRHDGAALNPAPATPGAGRRSHEAAYRLHRVARRDENGACKRNDLAAEDPWRMAPELASARVLQEHQPLILEGVDTDVSGLTTGVGEVCPRRGK